LDLLELRQICEILGITLVQFVRRFEKQLLIGPPARKSGSAAVLKLPPCV
jgi:hypothetical protein